MFDGVIDLVGLAGGLVGWLVGWLLILLLDGYDISK